ncbi:MAG: flagellar hook basal-body protein [Hyphomonadaceae bacterium]|nr:MAG: flagellar basal-body rod protein FlgG [Caulobacteraceae bacterium]MBT9445332.1 flagellar hook basal-body protein [Hyphomonadaceae bacterium]TPW04674.1 MAG: flagellar basal-body rod protein FlgG [Alphaproteobacteria bacterium]
MGGLYKISETAVRAATDRVDLVSRNVAGMTAPGFKGAFAVVIDDMSGAATNTGVSRVQGHTRFDQGALRATGATLDLAISGRGFFKIQGAETALYTRDGQFRRDETGRIVNAQGMALLGADGADIRLGDGHVEISPDGTVLEDGAPVGQIVVYDPEGLSPAATGGGANFVAEGPNSAALERPLIRQGMLEMSNVELSTEMIALMSAVRGAEIGAKLMQTYDGALEQAIAAFGKTGR